MDAPTRRERESYTIFFICEMMRSSQPKNKQKMQNDGDDDDVINSGQTENCNLCNDRSKRKNMFYDNMNLDVLQIIHA